MKYYLVIFLLALSVKGQSQSADSVALTTNGSWFIKHGSTSFSWSPVYNDYVWTTTYSFAYFRSGNDTVINDTTYTKLLRQALVKQTDGSYTAIGGENYYLAYRNDSLNRAVKVLQGNTVSQLWYDHNYEVGDTIWNPITLQSAAYIVVENIDSIDYCGTNYGNYHYQGTPHTSIKRIGSVLHFFNATDPFEADILIHFCENSVPYANVAGVEEIEKETILTVYPNPSNGILNISIDETIQSLKIFDLLGNLVFLDNSGAKSVLVNHLVNGTYIVAIQTGQQLITTKFINEN